MIRKLFKQMVISQVASAMSVMVCMVVDSIMIGKFLGIEAMAAYGYANPVLLFFVAFGSLLSTGVQVVCSKAMGIGDDEKINRCFSLSVVVGMTFSLLGVLAVVIFINPICEMLGAEPGTEVFRLTKDYLLGFIIGAPAFTAAQILIPYLQMSGQRLRLVAAVITMAVLDIGLDILNVTLVKMETFGMGMASTLSYYGAIIIGVTYFFKKSCIFKFSFKNLGNGLPKEIFLGGFPTVINQVSIVFLVLLVNNVMTDISGEIAVAAYSIVSTIANLGYCIGNGISEVTLMLTTISYNEEDTKSLQEIIKEQTRSSIVINLLAIGLLVIFSKPLVTLFVTNNPAAMDDSLMGVRLVALCLVVNSINAAFKKYYQATERVHFSESISVAQNFIFPAIVAIVLGHLIGVTGVWFYPLIGETLTLVYITIYVKIVSKKKFASLESYLCLPEGFGVPPEDALEIQITSLDDVEGAIEKVHEFCSERGESVKKDMYTALCIEEMAYNIVQHGFEEGRDNCIDIRLTDKSDEMLIRIRDNCKGFDPVKYFEIHKVDSDDPTEHIGIRMVFEMVKDVKYVNSLGLNCLTLTV